MDLKQLLTRLDGVKGGGTQYAARCPAHNDAHQSLSVSQGKDGRILLKCHAGCSVANIVGAMGLEIKDLYPEPRPKRPYKKRPETVAIYTYPTGAQKLRKSDKTFSWRRPDGNGGWLYSRQGLPHSLYVAGELAGHVVMVVEGEKDADNLHVLGYNAVSGEDGAGPGKWRREYTEQLRGLNVCVMGDNDDIGRAYAQETAAALHGAAKSVKLLDLSKGWAEIPEHGDISDLIAQKGADAACAILARLELDTTEWEPPPAQTKPAAKVKSLADLRPEASDRYGWHDIGNGYLFADWYKDRARYVPERKKWFIYNGKIWEPDTGNLRAMELCKKLADELAVYALSIPDERQRNDYLDFVRHWQRRNYRETVLKDAASVYPARLADFDKDLFLFNCLNGTLDLRTGNFGAHSPEDMLSKLSGVSYDPAARCERWERHISEVMEGSEGKALFLQKALGYGLTGDTRHECFFILYGPTSRNGKGLTMETFMTLMGDYGRTARPDSIAQKQTTNGSGPSEDIARLAGARFVNISEPDKKLVLSSALVKTLTGNDTITARFLNENSFEYRPQFKLFTNTNHLPTCTDVTLFSSDRVKIIPFERHFSEQERDTGLKAELARPENLSGILNWCLDGLKLIEETGFDAPEEVVEATADYRKSSDKIGRFVDEMMEPDPLAETRTGEVYPRYKGWCERNGFFPENAANFKSSLSNIATVTKRRPRSGGEKASLLLGYKLRNGL